MSGVLLSVAKLTRITAALKWLEVPGTVSIEVKPHQFSSLWKKKKEKKVIICAQARHAQTTHFMFILKINNSCRKSCMITMLLLLQFHQLRFFSIHM